MKLTKQELLTRKEKFIAAMNQVHGDWDYALFISKVNQYYFAGTIQNGLFVIKKNGDSFFFVRKSAERAKFESPITDNIYPMQSYRDCVGIIDENLGNAYIEDEVFSYAVLSRLQKYFKIEKIHSLENIVKFVRAVKSKYELHLMRESGKQVDILMKEVVPKVLKEGMSEAEFAGHMYLEMMKRGYQGTSRISAFQTEIAGGNYSFGKNMLLPTNFDGPGGWKGNCPAYPGGGSPLTKLQKGDLVFVDTCFTIEGYHTDKTQIFSFGKKPSDEVLKDHAFCKNLIHTISKKLVVGAIPSKIYEETIASLSEDELKGFMNGVRFLGHGVGLLIDEFPVIAKGFDMPLMENMTIALEPKKRIEGVGLVGVEETYHITKDGAISLTGEPQDIVVI
ncbi:MAG: Xaa-Pro peptidase family protein [Firmicutes bacterium]|nr:Xaa-Pro peptidase family protein [Bacillota bacterium]